MGRRVIAAQPVTSYAMEIAGNMRNIPFTALFPKHFAAFAPTPKSSAQRAQPTNRFFDWLFSPKFRFR